METTNNYMDYAKKSTLSTFGFLIGVGLYESGVRDEELIAQAVGLTFGGIMAYYTIKNTILGIKYNPLIRLIFKKNKLENKLKGEV